MPVDAPLYPVNLILDGQRCLVVGGGSVAAQKASGLLDGLARVHVVAAEAGPDVRALADGPGGERLEISERPYRRGEVAGYRLAITATDDVGVNRSVYLDGEEAGVWVNSADDPANCAFTLPSRVRQGPLLVTFATGGRSPAVATWLRRRFTDELGPEYATLIDVLAEAREEIRAAGGSSEGHDWQGALDSGMLELIRNGQLDQAKERLQACLSSSSG